MYTWNDVPHLKYITKGRDGVITLTPSKKEKKRKGDR
jgi:hypothetical protein